MNRKIIFFALLIAGFASATWVRAEVPLTCVSPQVPVWEAVSIDYGQPCPAYTGSYPAAELAAAACEKSGLKTDAAEIRHWWQAGTGRWRNGGNVWEQQVTCTYKVPNPSVPYCQNFPIYVDSVVVRSSCGDPPACNTPEGQSVDLIDLNFPADAAYVCAENCKSTPFTGLTIGTKSGQSGRVEFAYSTGQPCTTEPDVPTSENKCTDTDVSLCINNNQKPMLIDEYEDNPDPVPDNFSGADYPTMEGSDSPGCVMTASGGMFCIASAPTPSRPDDGTPGNPAAPDASGSTGVPFGGPGNGDPGSPSGGFHYYSPGTVSGSTNFGSGGGECDPDTEQCEGECDPETEECGPCDPQTEECGEGEGGSCPEGQECGFTPPKEGAGFSDLSKPMLDGQIALAAEYEDMREEMGELFSGVSEGSGSLPCASFQFFGSSIPICLTEYEDKLSVLRQLIILIATFGAALLVLGAKN